MYLQFYAQEFCLSKPVTIGMKIIFVDFIDVQTQMAHKLIIGGRIAAFVLD